jgi:hypothetical protein
MGGARELIDAVAQTPVRDFKNLADDCSFAGGDLF